MDVTIDGVNLTAEYGLEWYDVINEAPLPQTLYQEVPGRNGSIDLSEAVSGRVQFSDRNIKLSFLKDDRSPHAWAALCTALYTRFHGRRCRITLGNDPGYFYVGRISCQGTKATYVSSTYEISARCDPFKYKQELSSMVCAASASGTAYTFSNLFAPARPIFLTESSGLSVVRGGAEYSLIPGGVSIPELVFQAGENTLSLKGEGTATVTWQEGTL